MTKEVQLSNIVDAIKKAKAKLEKQQVAENFGAKEKRDVEDLAFQVENYNDRMQAFALVNLFVDWCETREVQM